MRVASIVRGLVFVLVVAGTSILAEPGQTAQPGQMTQGRQRRRMEGRLWFTGVVPGRLRI